MDGWINRSFGRFSMQWDHHWAESAQGQFWNMTTGTSTFSGWMKEYETKCVVFLIFQNSKAKAANGVALGVCYYSCDAGKTPQCGQTGFAVHWEVTWPLFLCALFNQTMLWLAKLWGSPKAQLAWEKRWDWPLIQKLLWFVLITWSQHVVKEWCNLVAMREVTDNLTHASVWEEADWFTTHCRKKGET